MGAKLYSLGRAKVFSSAATNFGVSTIIRLVASINTLGPYVGIICGKPHSDVWLTIGLAFGIFYRPAYTPQNVLENSDFCV